MKFVLLSLLFVALAMGQQTTPPPLVYNSTCNFWESYIFACGTEAVFNDVSIPFLSYDVVVTGDFTVLTGDTEGRVFVGGAANIGTGYSIGYGISYSPAGFDSPAPYGLVSLQQATWVSGELFPAGEWIYSGGLTLVPGSADNLQNRIRYDAFDNIIEEPVALLDNVKDYHTCLNESITNIVPSIEVEIYTVKYTLAYTGILLECPNIYLADPKIYSLVLTIEEFNQINWYSAGWDTNKIDGPECNYNIPWFIHIRGDGVTTAQFKGDNIQSTSGNVVYVFENVPTVNITTQVVGSIYTNGDVVQIAGNVIGRVIAKSYRAHNDSSQVSRACTSIANVLLVALVSGGQKKSGSNTVTVANLGGFLPGDKVYVGEEAATIAAVGEEGGKYFIQFEAPLSKSYSSGTLITGTVSLNGRGGLDLESSSKSSASFVAASFALIFALLIALF